MPRKKNNKLVCKICGSEFLSRSTSAETCSHKCRGKLRNYPTTCKECGKDFNAVFKHQIFCHVNCKNKFRVRERLKGIVRVCLNCTNTLPPKDERHKFCSNKCATKYNRAIPIIKTIKCADCGKPLTVDVRGNVVRCDDCRVVRSRTVSYNTAVKAGKIKKPGVGRGGNPLIGAANHRWNPYGKYHNNDKNKGYTSSYKNKPWRYWGTCCLVCGVSRSKNGNKLDVHHVNGDRGDNNLWNLVPLCKECHILKVHNSAIKWKDPEELLIALEKYWPVARAKLAECKNVTEDQVESNV